MLYPGIVTIVLPLCVHEFARSLRNRTVINRILGSQTQGIRLEYVETSLV